MEETLFYDHPEVVDADLADYLERASHYTLSCFEWLEEIRKSGRYLYSKAFSTSAAHVDCLELAALYTLQDRLARDAEQMHGFEHRYVAVGHVLDEAANAVHRHSDPPRCSGSDLLASNEAIVEPAMQGRWCKPESLGRALSMVMQSPSRL